MHDDISDRMSGLALNCRLFARFNLIDVIGFRFLSLFLASATPHRIILKFIKLVEHNFLAVQHVECQRLFKYFINIRQ